MRDIEAIKKSELILLLDVVQTAIGLYNVLERTVRTTEDEPDIWPAFDELGEALRKLGVNEVKADG
jgi:hypothetical protein